MCTSPNRKGTSGTKRVGWVDWSDIWVKRMAIEFGYLKKERKIVLSRDVLFKPEVVCNSRNDITRTESTCPTLHVAPTEEMQVLQNYESDDRNTASTSGGSNVSNAERYVQDRKIVREKTTALSTTEAEIVAASEGAKELVWLKRLPSELLSDFAEKTPLLYIDNASAIKLTKNPEYHKRSKHIEVQHFYVRERYFNDDIGIEHVDGRKQLADLLTKPIEHIRFEALCREIEITSGKQ